MFPITREPVPELYVCTVPSNRFAEFEDWITNTELPAIYASPVDTKRVTLPPNVGDNAAIPLVLYLSPFKPLAPVGPVDTLRDMIYDGPYGTPFASICRAAKFAPVVPICH